MAGMTGGSADLRIILLGKAGAGKSSTGDTILGEKLFTTSYYANSCNEISDKVTCKAETRTVNGRRITVIDTPGYLCTELPDEELKPEIAKCIIDCAPGPHAFLIVLAMGRQTAEEMKVVEEILKMFGEEALKYAVVLFTHGDQIHHNNVTIQEFVDKNRHLKTLVKKCGNRLFVIDNLYWNNPTAGRGDETRNSIEIKCLLNTIDQMVEQNGYYTNETLQAVAEAIEKEMVNIREETGGQFPEITVNKRAKIKRFLISAGALTGVLRDAFLGIAVRLLAKTPISSRAVVVAGAGAEGAAAASAATGIGLGATMLGLQLGPAVDQMGKQKRGKHYTKAVVQTTEADLRIVLLGKTGAGKSSTGNTILREKLFAFSCCEKSDTDKCKAETKTVNGKKITVIDTPGYLCTERPDEALKPEIAKCIVECAPGPHAFLIVLTVGRQTDEDKKVVDEILKMFGEEVLKYTVVLFTHGDQLLHNNVIVQNIIGDHLNKLVQKCGNRFLAIDNLYWNNPIADCGDETSNSKEIKRLLNIIDQMVNQNGGKHYTNEMLQAVAQAIEEERVKIKKETGGRLPEITVTERAKQEVNKRLVAGVTAGVLMGALLGVLGSVGAVVALVATGGVAAPIAVAVAAVFVGGIGGGVAGAKVAKEAATSREAIEGAVHAVARK